MVAEMVRSILGLQKRVERLETKEARTFWRVNVKDYGAKGDGATADADAIDAATASLTSGGTLFFPAGTYMINHTLFVGNPHIHWVGEGRASVIKVMTDAGCTMVYVAAQYKDWPTDAPSYYTSEHFECEELTFDGDYPNGQFIPSIARGCTADWETIKCKLSTNPVSTSNGTWEPHGILVHQSVQPNVHNCYFYNILGPAIGYYNTYGGDMHENYAYHCTLGLAAGYRNVLNVSCTTHNNYYPFPSNRRYKITSNTIYGWMDAAIDVAVRFSQAGYLIADNFCMGDPSMVWTRVNEFGSNNGSVDTPSAFGNGCAIQIEGLNGNQYLEALPSVVTGNVICNAREGIWAHVALVGYGSAESNKHKNLTLGYGVVIAGNSLTDIQGWGIHAFGDGVIVGDNAISNFGRDVTNANGASAIRADFIQAGTGTGVKSGRISILGNSITCDPIPAIVTTAVPASTAVYTSPYADARWVTIWGGTVTVIAIGGVTQVNTAGTNYTRGRFYVVAGGTVAITYSVVPWWRWWPVSDAVAYSVDGDTNISPYGTGEPLLPVNGTARTNLTRMDAMVGIWGGVVTAIVVDGVTQLQDDGVTNLTQGTVRVNAGLDITLTYPSIQTVVLSGSPTGGTFTLTYGALTTGAMNHDVSEADMQTALRLLAGLGSVTVARTGTDPNYTYTITFVGVAGVATTLTAASSLTGGTPVITVATLNSAPWWSWRAIGALIYPLYGISTDDSDQRAQPMRGLLIEGNNLVGPGLGSSLTSLRGINISYGWESPKIVNNVAENWWNGIYTEANAAWPIKQPIIELNQCVKNLDSGIVVYSYTENAIIQSNKCYDNGQSTAATYRSGIVIAQDNTTGAVLENNHCGNVNAVLKTQLYGIRMAGTTTNIVLRGGDLRGNGTGPVYSWTAFAQVLNVLFEDYYPALAEMLSAWVADDAQNPSLGSLLLYNYVKAVHVHVTEAFDSDGTDLLTVGYDADPDAFATSIDVSTTGVKTVTLGALAGYNGTTRAVEAYYVNGGSEPTAGKALVTLEYYRVPVPPA